MKQEEDNQIVYGPVASWRLGRSLGVDLICGEKSCSFNCKYCQLGGEGNLTVDRQEFLETDEVLAAVEEALNSGIEVDVITLSGSGEPTLATNLGEVIKGIKEMSELPVAVLTNGSLMTEPEVREELLGADIVKAKLDAATEEIFQELNQPHADLELEALVHALSKFARREEVFFALEIMLTPVNMEQTRRLAELAETISPDEVQINTPYRESSVKPLTDTELELATIPFAEKKLAYRVVNREERPEISDILSQAKMQKLKREGG